MTEFEAEQILLERARPLLCRIGYHRWWQFERGGYLDKRECTRCRARQESAPGVDFWYEA